MQGGGDFVSLVGEIRIRWNFMTSLMNTYNHLETLLHSKRRRMSREMHAQCVKQCAHLGCKRHS